MISAISLSALRAVYDRCVEYAETTRDVNIDAHLSEFWREILEQRANYPSFNEMLVMRRGFTYPIADRGNAEDIDAERAYARAAWDVVGRTVPLEYFDRFDESAVGSPTAFSFDGHIVTAGGIVNALTSYRIVQACERLGSVRHPLRILEIGAGYGQVAHQLLQQFDIATYAVCDLPENAFLSAFYLQANHPDREALFIGADGRSNDAQSGLVFTVPPYLERLDGVFDLIVNSYSFQEMTLESVRQYLDFATARLAPGGFLYSLNTHAKAGVRRPSDYAIECFALESLACPRRFPWQPNGTVPYEFVLRPRTAPALDGGRAARRRAQLDGLGGAMQLGLGDELNQLIDDFVQRAEGDHHEALDALAAAFAGDSAVERRDAAGRVPAMLGAYLDGIFAFITGDKSGARQSLLVALADLPDTHARVWTLLVLGALATAAGDHRDATARSAEAARIAPHLAADIVRLVGTPETARALLASRAGLEEPASAASPPSARWRRAANALSLSRSRPKTPLTGSTTRTP